MEGKEPSRILLRLRDQSRLLKEQRSCRQIYHLAQSELFSKAIYPTDEKQKEFKC